MESLLWVGGVGWVGGGGILTPTTKLHQPNVRLDYVEVRLGCNNFVTAQDKDFATPPDKDFDKYRNGFKFAKLELCSYWFLK